MSALEDPEFGTITLKRSRLARNIRLKLDARGIISVSLPMRTPLFIAKQLINDSRLNLRTMLAKIQARQTLWREGDLIGKSHILRLQQATTYAYRLEQTTLIVTHPPEPSSQQLQLTIRQGITEALRTQAKAYLSRRLPQLANQYNFTYQKLRFSSAGTRWGSCSNQGTISLTIWLMGLPFELIDYVLIHELCHTKEMNHSPAFWCLVEACCPDYKIHKRMLRTYHPHN